MDHTTDAQPRVYLHADAYTEESVAEQLRQEAEKRHSVQPDTHGGAGDNRCPSMSASMTEPTDYLEHGRPQSAAGLGLRPVTFNESAPHPDPSPCPAWCEYRPEAESHEVNVSSGGEVVHSGDSVSVRASLYQGKSGYGEAEFATLETHLKTRGFARPQLHVALRHYSYPGPEHHYHDLLKLTLDDARELATVLMHLVDAAEDGVLPST